MNENLNLVEKLKNVPIGTKFYTSPFEYLLLISIENNMITFRKNQITIVVNDKGKLNDEGECIIFPSKEQRDWDKWEFDTVPVGTPCAAKNELDYEWRLRIYAGEGCCYDMQSTQKALVHWETIIPLSEFDFVNLCRKEK